MTPTRLLARPLLASVFIAGGVDALRDPAARVPLAEPVTSKVSDVDPEMLVKVNAGVQVAAGTLLAIGRLPRLSAAALAGSMVPTTLAGHRFWEEQDATKRHQQRAHFLKNVSLLGALIIAAFDTEGAPSLGWRAKRAARHTAERTHELAASARAVLPHS